MKTILPAFFLLFPLSILLSNGSSEASAGSTGRGQYLAEEGLIIPPEEVIVDSYIALINYNYPHPLGDLGITLYNGNYQLSALGQESVLHLGLQGAYMDWDNIPCSIFPSS